MDQVFFDGTGRVRNGWKALLFFLCLGFANTTAFSLLGHAWLKAHGGLDPASWVLLFIALAFTWAFLRAEQRTLGSVGLRLGPLWLGTLAVGALGGAGLIGCTAAIVRFTGDVHLVRTPGSGPGGLLLGGGLFLGVALAEELTFRGYLFQRLEGGLGSGGAQALLAILFALVHWGNPGMTGATKLWATLNIALASLLLGLCYLRTRSLALPVGVHLGWNWAQGSLLGFGVSGTQAHGFWTPVFLRGPEWITGGRFGLEASLPCTVVTGLACVALWTWRRRKIFYLGGKFLDHIIRFFRMNIG